MRTSISRSLVALALAFSLLPLSACTKEPVAPPVQEQETTEQEITLSATNVGDYIGINFSFGEVCVTEMPSKNTDRISCVCYIDVFPKGEYKFNSTTLSLSLEYEQSLSDFTMIGIVASWDVAPEEITLKLDKDGYGRTSVYLSRMNHPKESPEGMPSALIGNYNSFREYKLHPSQFGKWSIRVKSTSGVAIVPIKS